MSKQLLSWARRQPRLRRRCSQRPAYAAALPQLLGAASREACLAWALECLAWALERWRALLP